MKNIEDPSGKTAEALDMALKLEKTIMEAVYLTCLTATIRLSETLGKYLLILNHMSTE